MIRRMPGWRLCLPAALAVLFWTATPAGLWGAARVEMVIVAQSQLGADFHQWSRILTEAGAARVQIGGGPSGDTPGISVQGPTDSPTYVVIGSFNARGDLILPGGARFSRSDSARLAQWIVDLSKKGLPETRETRSAFGLTASQLQQVREDLSRVTGVPTEGRTRDEVLKQIAGRLAHPVRLEPRVGQELAEQKVLEDLSTLSCGTAIACLLRPAGYGMVPHDSGRDLDYRVVPAKGQHDLWPVGWTSKRPDREVLPGLYEFLNVNIQNVSATTAMVAIAKRLNAPVLLDHNALTQHGIEPDKVMVKLPAGRSTYSLTLRKVLFQAGLKFDVRVDEAEHPILWITSIKPAG